MVIKKQAECTKYYEIKVQLTAETTSKRKSLNRKGKRKKRKGKGRR